MTRTFGISDHEATGLWFALPTVSKRQYQANAQGMLCQSHRGTPQL